MVMVLTFRIASKIFPDVFPDVFPDTVGVTVAAHNNGTIPTLSENKVPES